MDAAGGGAVAVACHDLGLDDLIRAKEAADRPQDWADLVVLRKAKKRAP
jgi:hypothetical protein